MITAVVVALVIVLSPHFLDLYFLQVELSKVPLAESESWGVDGPDTLTPQTFQVHVPDSVLTDLKTRLHARRHSPRMVVPNPESWDYGIDPNFLSSLLDYWQNEYEWRHHEAMLNDLGLYSLVVDGLKIVFHRVMRGGNNNSRAILLLHGWPGSIHEFRTLIADHLLSSLPEDVDLVVPCLPGYGFSSAPTRPGMDPSCPTNSLCRPVLQNCANTNTHN